MENLYRCGTCGWWKKGKNQPEKDDRGTPLVQRGYCFNNPPTVFIIPNPSRVQAMGQQGMELRPMMQRPILEANEPMCSKYIPVSEAYDAIRDLDADIVGDEGGASSTEE